MLLPSCCCLQGASVAAVLCALQQQQRQQSLSRKHQQQQQEDGARKGSVPDGEIRLGDDEYDGDCDFGFRFAILASGFLSPCPQHRELLAEVGPLELPSLHVYGSTSGGDGEADSGDGDGGGGGNGGFSSSDRQIVPHESEALVAAFSCAAGRRRSLRHNSGHLIPATRSHAATFRNFLAQFSA